MTRPDACVTTERIRLRPMGEGDFDALLQGLEDPDRPWAVGYPLDASLVAAAMVRERRRADDSGPWTQYQAQIRETGLIVGDLTLLEPPDREGVVLVTFGIAREQRRQGYATEMLRAVVAWATERSDVRGLRADTDLVNAASHQVLRAAGLAVVQDEGDRQVYERRWSAPGRPRPGTVTAD